MHLVSPGCVVVQLGGVARKHGLAAAARVYTCTAVLCGWEQGREVDGREGVGCSVGFVCQGGRLASSVYGMRSLQRSRRNVRASALPCVLWRKLRPYTACCLHPAGHTAGAAAGVEACKARTAVPKLVPTLCSTSWCLAGCSLNPARCVHNVPLGHEGWLGDLGPAGEPNPLSRQPRFFARQQRCQ